MLNCPLTMASFERALEQSLPIQKLGDVHLRYEQGLLCGETRPQGRSIGSQACLLLAGGAGALGTLLVLFVRAALSWSLLLAGAVAGLLLLAASLELKARSPRRFVLDFTAATLRLDYPHLARPVTKLVAFERVEGLRRRQVRAGYCLEVLYQDVSGAPQAGLLVGEVGAKDLILFERLYKLLEGALATKKVPV